MTPKYYFLKSTVILMAMVVFTATASSCTKKVAVKKTDKNWQDAAQNKQPTEEAKKRDKDVMRKTNTEEAELVGEVIDAWCYCSKVMGDGRGKEHEKCAKLCVAGGVSAGILTDDGTVYIAAKHQGYKGCNGLLLPYVAKRVRVKGWIAERGGCKVVKIREVELVDKEDKDAADEKTEDHDDANVQTGTKDDDDHEHHHDH